MLCRPASSSMPCKHSCRSDPLCCCGLLLCTIKQHAVCAAHAQAGLRCIMSVFICPDMSGDCKRSRWFVSLKGGCNMGICWSAVVWHHKCTHTLFIESCLTSIEDPECAPHSPGGGEYSQIMAAGHRRLYRWCPQRHGHGQQTCAYRTAGGSHITHPIVQGHTRGISLRCTEVLTPISA